MPEHFGERVSSSTPDPRSALALYCDDVRHENTGKLMLIGVYGDAMIVAEAPFLLPRLCILLVVRTSFDRPFSKLVVRVFKDSEVIFESASDPQGLEVAKDLLPDKPDPTMIFKRTQIIRLEPFVSDGPCVLRVRVETESEVLRAGALRVLIASDQSPPNAQEQ